MPSICSKYIKQYGLGSIRKNEAIAKKNVKTKGGSTAQQSGVPLEEEFKTAKCQAEVPARVPLEYRFTAGFERYLTGT